MRSTKKAQSSACKVTRSDGKKTGGGGGGEKKVSVEEAEGSSVEQLLQQQEVSDQSITTVDEVVVKGPVVPQPSGGAGCPPFRFQLQPGGETGGGQLEQQQQVPPLQIYSPGSPPLPLGCVGRSCFVNNWLKFLTFVCGPLTTLKDFWAYFSPF